MMKLNNQGFITHYLISGPIETEYQDTHRDSDQLRYEHYLRSKIADEALEKPNKKIVLGQVSELDRPWEYYYSYGNWFVDRSTFYPILRKIEFYAVTHLEVYKNCKISATLWTYGACEIWVNDYLVCKVKEPVYKPIKKQEIVLPLTEGENEIFIRFQNLGVRDTRNIFGIQIKDKEAEVAVKLPDWTRSKQMVQAAEVLNRLELRGGDLYIEPIYGYSMQLKYDKKIEDYSRQCERYEVLDITGQTKVSIKKGIASLIVTIEKDGMTLSRKLEVTEAIQPIYHVVPTQEEGFNYSFTQIAEIGQILRGATDRFAMYPVLARKALNCSRPEDEEEILNDLQHLENRRDCSDFLSCALMRYCKLYPMSKKLRERTKEVLLNYRYWMDEEGADGMCFWSENHSLMFYITAYFAGQMYPDEIFKRSGKTGTELSLTARTRIMEWLEDVVELGFEEFQSGGYTPITFGALLCLVDFAEDDISQLARTATDKMVTMLALHSFKGCVVSPQGRVYREVLYPFAQSVQQMLYLIDSKVPYQCSEWVSTLATSRYRFPKGLEKLMQEEVTTEYVTGNALVKLCKTQDYLVTSVASPIEDKNKKFWENISFDNRADKGSFAYCKSLNERFHGTSKFEPGVYGYQQHMWYAAIDNDTVIFVNHPGGTCDATTMRPGYWFGNGEMPALKQEQALIGAVYNISQDYPIAFTHMYFPIKRFEIVKQEGNWYFGKKGNGYVGIWCSSDMVPHNDQLFDCEFRAYGNEAAYVSLCGSQGEYGSWELFMAHCLSLKPIFNGKILEVGKDFQLEYIKHDNRTQYI